MLGPIARVEEAAAYRDKGVVVLALQETIAVSVDLGDSIGVGNTDVVWLDANEHAVLLVRLVDGQIALPLAGLPEQPEVGPRGREGGRDVADAPIAEVRQQVVEHGEQEHRVGRDHDGQEHGEWNWRRAVDVRREPAEAMSIYLFSNITSRSPSDVHTSSAFRRRKQPSTTRGAMGQSQQRHRSRVENPDRALVPRTPSFPRCRRGRVGSLALAWPADGPGGSSETVAKQRVACWGGRGVASPDSESRCPCRVAKW
jgi:hypothetical protein